MAGSISTLCKAVITLKITDLKVTALISAPFLVKPQNATILK